MSLAMTLQLKVTMASVAFNIQTPGPEDLRPVPAAPGNYGNHRDAALIPTQVNKTSTRQRTNTAL